MEYSRRGEYFKLAEYLPLIFQSHDRESAIGIATGYGLDGRWVGVRVPVRTRFVSSPHSPDRF
jgi:hypothetical protein